MADDNLRIGAEFNVTPIVEGANAAAAAVQSAGARINAATESVGASAQRMAEGFMSAGVSAEDAAEALRTYGYSAAEIAAATGIVTGQTEKAVVATRNYGLSMAEARLEAAALTGSTTGLGFAFARLATQSELLSGLIQLTFPIFLVVGFVEVLGRVVDYFAKMYEKQADLEIGWDKIDHTFQSFDRGLQEKLDKENDKIVALTQGPLAGFDQKIKEVTFDVDTFYNHMNTAFDEFTKQIEKTGRLGFTNFLKEVFGTAGMGEQEVIDKAKAVQVAYDEAGDDVDSKHRALADGIADVNARLAQLANTSGTKDIIADYTKLLAMLVNMNQELFTGTELAAKQREALGVEKQVTEEKERHRIAVENANAEIRLQEELKRVKMPPIPEPALFEAMNTEIPKVAATWEKGLQEILAAQEKFEDQIDITVLLGTQHRFDEIQKEKEKELKIEEDAEAKKQAMYARGTNTLNNALKQWMLGYDNFGKAMEKLWANLAETAATNLLKVAEQEAIALIRHKAMAKEGILTDAKTAAASAFKEGMKLPFPLDFIIAPVLAAGAFAGVLAFSSFQGGGVTSGETLAHLHANEMVLPESLSSGIQKIIAAGGVTNNRHQNVNVHFNGGTGGMSHADIVRAVRIGIRRGELLVP